MSAVGRRSRQSFGQSFWRKLPPCGIALAAALALGALAGSAAHAAGPLDERGALKAVTCAACHGQAGNSRSSAMPIIAGRCGVLQSRSRPTRRASASRRMEPYAKQVLNLGVDDVAATSPPYG
jgi:cytochrome c553